MILTASQLRGIDYRSAELLGKPHIGAFYQREDARTHRLMEGSLCVVCHQEAHEAHHVVPRRKTLGWTLNTERGRFVVMSPLFAVCRHCHDGFHGGARYEVKWRWKNEQYMKDWWEGRTLSLLPTHHEALFEQGYYMLVNIRTGEQGKLTW